MADTIDTTSRAWPVDTEQDAPSRTVSPPTLWSRLALGAILLLSVFMEFFQLGQNGYGNLYYAAGVRSMADSLHNFFFVSLDPGGFVTIDKPPLGFWLQTFSTKIFGFTPFAIFLPQAICGVLAVWLLYALVRRHFGVTAGLIAALVLAVSPVSVVTDRNNTIDGTLALVLLLSAWAIIHAAESGKLRWLLLSALFVGLGFNIKMSEAYLVVPALGLTYLLCAPRSVWTRIWHLLLALLVLLVISLSWAAIVDLTPVAQRPYVGSTQDNSELSLAIGYNGLNRLHLGGLGNAGRNRAGGTTTPAQNDGTNAIQSASNELEQALGNGFRAGAGGPLSLLGASMGGQIGWLLPLALLGVLALLWQRRLHLQRDRQQLALILWGFWLITMAIFFTVDGSFHQYYLTEMAPGLSAMVGIGLVMMWKDYRSAGWRGWLLPVALVLTAVAQVYILMNYPSWARWMSPLIAILTALAVIALIIFRIRPRFAVSTSTLRIATLAVGVGLLALLIAPTVWAGYSVFRNVESSDPTAGPTATANFGGNGFGGAGGYGGYGRQGNGANRTDRSTTGRNNNAFGSAFGGGSASANPALVAYLESHQGSDKFMVATTNASTAEPFILSTNRPVMAMGGFSGSDPILTTADLQSLISNGTVRFFLINSARATPGSGNSTADRNPEEFRGDFGGRGGFGGFGGGYGQSSALSSWVSSHCSAVPASAWQTTTGSGSAEVGGSQLYDCAAAR